MVPVTEPPARLLGRGDLLGWGVTLLEGKMPMLQMSRNGVACFLQSPWYPPDPLKD